MKRIRKPRVHEFSEDELDELVAAEIDAIIMVPPKTPETGPRGDAWPSPFAGCDRVTHLQRRRSPVPAPKQEASIISAGDLETQSRKKGGLDHLHAVPTGNAAPDFQEHGWQGAEQAPGRLFDEAEERFIVDAVTWLRPRANKDVIIAGIWTKLTEAEPDTFYSPEAGNVTDTENSPPQGAKSGE